MIRYIRYTSSKNSQEDKHEKLASLSSSTTWTTKDENEDDTGNKGKSHHYNRWDNELGHSLKGEFMLGTIQICKRLKKESNIPYRIEGDHIDLSL